MKAKTIIENGNKAIVRDCAKGGYEVLIWLTEDPALGEKATIYKIYEKMNHAIESARSMLNDY